MVIVFDVDGTLFDTKNEIISSLNVVLERRGIEGIENDESNKFIGPPFSETLPRYRGVDHKEVIDIVNEFRIVYKSKIIKSKPYEGIIESIRALSDMGFILGVATMKPEDQLDTLFKEYNLDIFFKVRKSRDGIFFDKRSMLNSIKREYSNETEFVMVGDTQGDYIASIESKFDFIYAGYGYGTVTEINCYKFYTLNGAQDLRNVISALSGIKDEI